MKSRLATYQTLSLGVGVMQPWHWKSLDPSESVTGDWIIGGFQTLAFTRILVSRVKIFPPPAVHKEKRSLCGSSPLGGQQKLAGMASS